MGDRIVQGRSLMSKKATGLRVASIAVALALVASACGGQEADDALQPEATPAPSPSGPTSENQEALNSAPVRAGLATADEVRIGGTLVSGALSEPGILNPMVAFDDQAFRIAAMVFSPLVGSDLVHYSTPNPALAESWEVNADATKFTFKIHSGVTWHDGQPLTAEDVRWTMQAVIDNRGSVAATLLSDVVSVEAPDNLTVVVNLANSNTAWIEGLGIPQGFFVLPKHLLENENWQENAFNTNPIGSGPFKFENWERGSFISLTANTDFFLGRPPIDRIVQRFYGMAELTEAFRQGEVQYVYDRLPVSELVALQDLPDFRIDRLPLPQVQWFAFNIEQEETFQDVRVRRAFAHAIDAREISDRAYGGVWEPNTGVFPINAVYNNKTTFAHDPELAERLLDEAGFPRGSDGTRLTVDWSYAEVMGNSDVGAVVRDQLAKVGIAVRLDSMDWPTYSQSVIQDRKFQIGTGAGWQGPDPNELAQFFTTGGRRNMGGYSNAEVDALFASARATTDFNVRRDIYLEIQEILFDEVPRVQLVTVANSHPILSCVKMPWYDEAAQNAVYNIFTGFLYTWLEEGCGR